MAPRRAGPSAVPRRRRSDSRASRDPTGTGELAPESGARAGAGGGRTRVCRCQGGLPPPERSGGRICVSGKRNSKENASAMEEDGGAREWSGGPRPGPANWGTATPPRVPEATPQERRVLPSGAEPSQRRSSEPKSIGHANPKHALPRPGMPAGTTPSPCPRPRLPPRSGSPGGSEGAALPDWSDLATGGRQGRSSLLPWAVPALGSDMN